MVSTNMKTWGTCAGLLTVALFLAQPARAFGTKIFATGHDAITTPNTPVAARAKFEWNVWGYVKPDVRGHTARFSFPNLWLTGTTNDDGVASVQVSAASVGVVPFEVELPGKSGKGKARLFVLDPNRPAAVVDIDGTLSDLPDWRVPFDGDEAPAFAGSPELLRDLAKTHDIIYLTARDDCFDAITRAFLRRHDFPDGAVIYNDLGLTSTSELEQLVPGNHGAFKLQVIRDLEARGVNVQLGIGNAETDAWAYEQAGLSSFINTDQVGTGSSFRFSDYAWLRLELIQRGILPA